MERSEPSDDGICVLRCMIPPSAGGVRVCPLVRPEEEGRVTSHGRHGRSPPLHGPGGPTTRPRNPRQVRLGRRSMCRWNRRGPTDQRRAGLGTFANTRATRRAFLSTSTYRRSSIFEAAGEGAEMTSRAGKLALTLDTLSAVPLWVASPLMRPWHMRWGATESEIRLRMPGDEVVPRAQFNATRAVRIDAPPKLVWPWIVQVGYRRAGFYTYDQVDNAGEPGATASSANSRTSRSATRFRCGTSPAVSRSRTRSIPSKSPQVDAVGA